MKNILSREAAPLLEEVARDQMLLVFDFDGILAPIVEAPVLADMPPSTRALLRIVAGMYPCAVVSGRSRADLLPRVGGVPLAGVVGNHGAEAEYGLAVNRSLGRVVTGWIPALDARLRGVQGIEVEDKGLSIAIHYRRARSRAEARRAIHRAAEALAGARVFDGRAVVNVVPARADDKGAAVSKLLARFGRARALYVGDDTTDEDALRGQAIAVSIQVRRTRFSAAGYYLPSQKSIDELLRALVRARRKMEGRDDGTGVLDGWTAADA
jgi:trehalose 6-phosphate phosphatase